MFQVGLRNAGVKETKKTGELRRGSLRRQVRALFSLLSDLYGPDKLVLKAGRLGALKQMRSDDLAEQIVALQKLVNEDPTIELVPSEEEFPKILESIQDRLADAMARRSIEERIESKVARRMQEKHEEYVNEVRLQVVKQETGPENAQTLKRLAILEKMERTKLTTSMMEVLRPKSLSEVVGQERAVKSLLMKIASPCPQHVILYGPPGVGKTTVARLVLQEAKAMKYTPFSKDAPFVEVDGSTLRWDPREATNPLLGSVHDPIYQGARREFADVGIPEPKLGLVTEAHGGVLFIDEIGELDPLLQHKLLKVLEDKRVSFDSSYYDPSDPTIPRYIKKLFEEGAPADFVLIGATTRDLEELNPALRSRCAEVFFDPLTPADIVEIVRRAARKLRVKIGPGVAELVAEFTMEGRKAISLLVDAYSLAFYRRVISNGSPLTISVKEMEEVVQTARLTLGTQRKASDIPQVGKAFAVGVCEHVGSILEIEVVAFEARERGAGHIRFNETAGSMARDSVFNAASVIRRLTGQDLADFDIHVNMVGGGRVDGPSAGAAITIAIMSALTGRPVRQDVAITGEVSIQGNIKAVGGIYEKAHGARNAGMKTLLYPAEISKEVPSVFSGIELVPVRHISEVVDLALVEGVRDHAAPY